MFLLKFFSFIFILRYVFSHSRSLFSSILSFFNSVNFFNCTLFSLILSLSLSLSLSPSRHSTHSPLKPLMADKCQHLQNELLLDFRHIFSSGPSKTLTPLHFLTTPSMTSPLWSQVCNTGIYHVLTPYGSQGPTYECTGVGEKCSFFNSIFFFTFLIGVSCLCCVWMY